MKRRRDQEPTDDEVVEFAKFSLESRDADGLVFHTDGWKGLLNDLIAGPPEFARPRSYSSLHLHPQYLRHGARRGYEIDSQISLTSYQSQSKPTTQLDA
jgi:hypothetical protein